MIILDMLYFVFYRVFYRIVLFLMFALKAFFPKVAKGFELRKKTNGIPPWNQFPKNTQPLWIHCPSGEFEYALPVIRELKAQDPLVKILVTYYTPSYVARISKEPLVDFYCPLPWDTAQNVAEFIEHHKPQQLLIARTGLWPQMLEQCHQHQVPVSLFSMTFNKQLTIWNRFFFRWLYRYVNAFYVVSQEDYDTVKKINSLAHVQVTGDSRYDQCLYRLNSNTFLKINKDNLQKKVFVCASTWPEDEAVLLPLVAKNTDALHWIIVPHEIDKKHIQNIQQQLPGLPTFLYSQIKNWDGDGVLIVDELGVLASLYKLADGSFVGGSFKSRVHSVMESLACGNVTFVGPHHTNNREALEFSKFKKTTIEPVQIIKNSTEVDLIMSRLNKWTSSDKEVLKKAFIDKSGVSKHLAQVFLKIKKH